MQSVLPPARLLRQVCSSKRGVGLLSRSSLNGLPAWRRMQSLVPFRVSVLDFPKEGFLCCVEPLGVQEMYYVVQCGQSIVCISQPEVLRGRAFHT